LLQNCRHIVKYHRHEVNDDTYAIVMDEVDGCTGTYIIELAQHGVHLTEKELRNIARSICEFIQDCHAQNVMYADIKPSNMIYTPPDRLTMIDVGCARVGNRFEKHIGTPLYFSPEKLSKDYGVSSDVWSVGVLLYQFVCGYHPFSFRPEDLDMLHHEVVSTPLTFHHPHWDAVSSKMKDLLTGMLVKKEQDRLTIEQVMQHPWWDAKEI
jgi:aurora kinase